jgi:hypothetical protein
MPRNPQAQQGAGKLLGVFARQICVALSEAEGVQIWKVEVSIFNFRSGDWAAHNSPMILSCSDLISACRSAEAVKDSTNNLEQSAMQVIKFGHPDNNFMASYRHEAFLFFLEARVVAGDAPFPLGGASVGVAFLLRREGRNHYPQGQGRGGVRVNGAWAKARRKLQPGDPKTRFCWV